MTPRISVIVSTYRAEAFLRGRLDDLIAQTVFPQSEIIVVISGSPEGEAAIVREYHDRHSNIIPIATKVRETIYRAWNRGIAEAKGLYIANANTDDRCRPDSLEKLAFALDAHPKAAMAYGDQVISSTPNATFRHSRHGYVTKRYRFSRLRLLSGYHLGSQQMWRASLHREEGLWFNEDFEVTGDYDFACRVAERHALILVPETLGSYYLSVTKANKQFQDVDRFLSEDASVQETYTRRYLDSLADEDLRRLDRISSFWVTVPAWLHRFIHLSASVLNRRWHPIGLDFWYWLRSLIEFRRGNVDRAIDLCEWALPIARTQLIRRQLDRLKRGST